MGFVKTAFDLYTIKFRPTLQERIRDELLFEMPRINSEPVIIMGSTSATALLVDAAVKAGHKRFFIVGGKEVGDEDPKFTKILNASLKELGLPQPSSPSLKEHEYGREILHRHFGVAAERIATRPGFDTSTNTQQNMEVLYHAGYPRLLDSMEIYTLAGTARRVIGTARQVWDNATATLAVHNVYPPNVTRDNWMDDPASRFFAVSEAGKVLSGPDGAPSSYERKRFCRPVDVQAEIGRANEYIAQQARRWADFTPATRP